ncbi:hypothetical protein THIOM_000491 [Candidatus Thiomargarita nelsonii]|uniref:Uncharacterized protein n=1 Tax=Candidatus Thiomargarita nelsonii TaxID=1003181 RepID=A0A176S6P1_9GAMM|nr:hypothetical protein THIOM_000491 [Candidatus Thiomargarita nelsonii]
MPNHCLYFQDFLPNSWGIQIPLFQRLLYEDDSFPQKKLRHQITNPKRCKSQPSYSGSLVYFDAFLLRFFYENGNFFQIKVTF